MLDHHVPVPGDGGQVDLPVPFFQLAKIQEQEVCLLIRQRDAQFVCAAYKNSFAVMSVAPACRKL